MDIEWELLTDFGLVILIWMIQAIIGHHLSRFQAPGHL